ncbi:hypothetical protein BH10PAT3_BH10PAT3_7870 [soil metagenome]
MPTAKKKINLYESEEGAIIQKELRAMAADLAYNTGSSYSADSSAYSDNLIPFVDKHMRYLIVHPSVDPVHYLANLRLMTRIR